MMTKRSLNLLTLVALLLIAACKTDKRVLKLPDTDLTSVAFIPKPLEMQSSSLGFPLDSFTAIQTTTDDAKLLQIAQILQQHIKTKTDLSLVINPKGTETVYSRIYFDQLNDTLYASEEAYQLSISSDSVIVKTNTSEGAFRAVQTLRQLIPEQANDTVAAYPVWVLPGGTIKDQPSFEYRGAMLDVARHFFSVEEVKRYIDLLAYYKYNVLHLHLSDDQGWRIEIKAWPKLTEVGGSTEVGGGEGGFYTQEDYKELVAYAAKHYITIVPEIDMPGHTNAASVSYPILNGNGKEVKLYTGMRVGFSTFDTRKDTVYAFIDDVIREISELTPGPYFHIGGDESDATKKNDYIYFVERVEKIVQKYDKQLIGWDEIGQASLSSTSISQFWNHTDFVQRATDQNMKVILSPASRTYLDMKYDSVTKLGLKWAGLIPVDTGYQWQPDAYPGIDKKHVLGIEAPLWSETITNSDELEQLAFPRAIGYAELAWTPKELRDWESYKKRLAEQTGFLERMKVNYYRSPLIDWKENDFKINNLKK